MIEPHAVAPRRIDFRVDTSADFELAALQYADMRDRLADFLGVLDFEHGAGVDEVPRVTDLTAALRVKRRAIEHDLPSLARGERLNGDVVLDDRDDVRRLAHVRVAGELRALR